MNGFVKQRIESYGKVPLCNGMKDRAPLIGRFSFPLCWRCLGLVGGSLAGYAVSFSNIEAPFRITLGFFLAFFPVKLPKPGR